MALQRTYPPGVTSWVDLEQPDVEAAMAFYGPVLGWTFMETGPPPDRYVIAQVDGLDAAGIGAPARPSGTWQTYVAVDDVAAALDRVTAADGTLTTGPTDAGEAGTWAAFTDPQGAALRVWRAGRRLGAQIVNAPGAWNFSDLHTSDLSAAFYVEAFGWEIDDVGFAAMIRVPGYGDHLAATTDPDILERQAEVAAPPGFADAIGWVAPLVGDEQPHWHVTFAVADRDATAALATGHGGVVVESDDTDWTRTATIRDPQGAVFTASQFTPPG